MSLIQSNSTWKYAECCSSRQTRTISARGQPSLVLACESHARKDERLTMPDTSLKRSSARSIAWSEVVVRGGVEPPTFRFSGAIRRSRTVASRRLICHLAATIVARGRLLSLEVCLCWLPVGSPNLAVWRSSGLHTYSHADRLVISDTTMPHQGRPGTAGPYAMGSGKKVPRW
jgi:hypothetical protein